MRVLQMVILALIAAYPEDVLCARKSMREAKKANLGPCGQKYLRMINNKCYYIGVKKMSWFGAQNNCLRKNLNLVDLATAEDFEAIIKFLKSRGSLNDYWWGGNDLQSEGRFTYISTGRPVKYLGGQGKIEPTARSNEDDCLEVRLRENSSLVIDENCQEKQYFVCQRPDAKCAHPIEDAKADDRHSHEHLHHFHHNPAATEGAGAGGGGGSQEGSGESDSRPADNSNSTEIGVSPEEDEKPEEKPAEEGSKEGSGEKTKEEGGGEGEDGGGEGGEGGEEGGQKGEGGGEGRDLKNTTPGDAKKTTKAKAEGKTTTPAAGAATTVAAPEGEATTAAPEGEATTVAPEGEATTASVVEGETTAAGGEGEATTPAAEGEPATPGAEGEITAAPPEGDTTPAEAPAAETPAAF